MGDAPLVISLHIPKTAGTTFHNLLNAVYGDRHYRVPNSGGGIDVLRRTQKKLDFNYLQCVSGHMSYGLHEILPPGREYIYITFLRDPADRLLSYYYYVKSKQNHSQHHWMSKISFTDWVKMDRLGTHDNEMTRFLSGRPDVHALKPQSMIARSDFDIAVENIGKFAFVGITEDFDNGVRILADLLGWVGVPHERRWLVSKNRLKKDKLHPSVLEFIKKRHKWDYLLYEKAKENYHVLSVTQSQFC